MSNLLQSIPEGRIVRIPSHTPTLQVDTDPDSQDFAGQKLVDSISRIILISSIVRLSYPCFTQKNSADIPLFRKVISFIAGFALQDIRVTFGLFGAATVLLSLVRSLPLLLPCS